MNKYRKKPVTIEAVQFTGLNPTEIKDFVGENCEVEIYDNEVTPPVAHIVIHTLEGDMEVSKGDYVIKGVNGEFYPCKPDIFQQTYESEEPDKSLEKAAINHSNLWYCSALEELNGTGIGCTGIANAFIAGWKCRDDKMPMPEDTVLFQKGVAEGRRLEKEDMLGDAVEGYMDKDHIVTEGPFYYIRSRNLDLPNGLKEGDKIHIIIVKEEKNGQSD